VGYRDAGGLSESVVDGETGVLVEDLDGFVDAVARLIEDAETRRRMGSAAAARAGSFHWEAAVTAWEQVLMDAVAKRR
jgi:glycosyltransferase involved in cell wall biosynthesis